MYVLCFLQMYLADMFEKLIKNDLRIKSILYTFDFTLDAQLDIWT